MQNVEPFGEIPESAMKKINEVCFELVYTYLTK